LKRTEKKVAGPGTEHLSTRESRVGSRQSPAQGFSKKKSWGDNGEWKTETVTCSGPSRKENENKDVEDERKKNRKSRLLDMEIPRSRQQKTVNCLTADQNRLG